jgi:chloramphenicol 3-O-phosphotransferase
MKLIIIYGAEASGKLTIARNLAEKTNLKLFHNHVSIDVGKVLFSYGEDAYNELVWNVRLLVFESAAKNKLPGVIFTWAYSHPGFQPQLDRLLESMKPYDVEVHYVYVSCSQEMLEQRVQSSARFEAGKISTVEKLREQQKIKNHAEIPNTDSLVIDNTNLPPDKAADMIVREFKLVIEPSVEERHGG